MTDFRYQVWINPGYIEITAADAPSCLRDATHLGKFTSIDAARRGALRGLKASQLDRDSYQTVAAVIRALRASDIAEEGVVVPLVAPVTVEAPSMAASEFTVAVARHVAGHPIWEALKDQVMTQSMVMLALSESAANNIASHYGKRPPGVSEANIHRMLVADFLIRGAVGVLKGCPHDRGLDDSQTVGFMLRQAQAHIADFRSHEADHMREHHPGEQPVVAGDEIEQPTDDMRDWLLSRVGVELGVGLEETED